MNYNNFVFMDDYDSCFFQSSTCGDFILDDATYFSSMSEEGNELNFFPLLF